MLEKTSKSIKKSLNFEESGETFSIEIYLENVSQDKNTIISFLDTLYERIKKESDVLPPLKEVGASCSSTPVGTVSTG